MKIQIDIKSTKMRFFFLIPLLALVAADPIERKVSVSRSSYNKTYYAGDLIFQDEFDRLNTDVWHYEINMNGGYNNEFQIYNNIGQNAYIKDGSLWIRPSMSLDTMFNGNYEQLYNGYLNLPHCTDAPGSDSCQRQAHYPYILPPTVSTRLKTMGSFSFTYGKIEIRAKLPSGDWMWPAIWMLPEESRYGQWPRSGEIDIMESRGNRFLEAWGGQIGCEQSAATLHFGPSQEQNGHMFAHGTKNTPRGWGFDREFHLYQVEWNPDLIRFSIDNEEFKLIRPTNGGFFELGQFPANIPNPWTNSNNFKMAPFDQNFHFVLNVAVGGDYFPDGSNPPKPWGTQQSFLDFLNAYDGWHPTWDSEDAAMAIDYIRVYAI